MTLNLNIPILDIGILLLQIAVCGVALWYTLETRRMRLSASEQLVLLKQQILQNVAPYIVPGVVDVNGVTLKSALTGRTDLPDKVKEEILKRVEAGALRYIIAVANPTERIASNLAAFIYDSGTKSFLMCDSGKEWIEAKGQEIIQISEPFFSADEIKARVVSDFGTQAQFIAKQLEPAEQSYILALFHDIEGRPYAVKRPFTIKGKDVMHKPGKFIKG